MASTALYWSVRLSDTRFVGLTWRFIKEYITGKVIFLEAGLNCYLVILLGNHNMNVLPAPSLLITSV